MRIVFLGFVLMAMLSSPADALNYRRTKIKPVHSEKCLDVAFGSRNDGANLVQFTCGPQPNQLFTIRDMGNGLHRITPRHVRDKCLDVKMNSGQNGAEIVQFTCNGQTNQRFLIERVGTSTPWRYRIKSVSSSKCLDIKDGTVVESAKLIQFDCNDTTNQLFRFD